MGPLTCGGAVITCSFGAAPSSLIVLPHPVMGTLPHASVMDHAPIVNIPPFGMCMSPSNPMVAAATAAALGGPFPALDMTSKLVCSWGGLIQIGSPGQTTVTL